jgi:hypothetical protein
VGQEKPPISNFPPQGTIILMLTGNMIALAAAAVALIDNDFVVVRREAAGVFHQGTAGCSSRILAGELAASRSFVNNRLF